MPAKNITEQFREATLPRALNTSELSLLECFYDVLSVWNLRVNLVSRRSFESAFAFHFVDSVCIANFVLKTRSGLPIYDVGSGGGFPGIVIAILAPELKITLFERTEKKRKFLSEAIEALSLENIELRGLFERQGEPVYACSRAAIPVSEFFAFFAKSLVAKSRCALCLGGNQEVRQPPSGFSLVRSERYQLPADAGMRSIAVYLRR